MELYVVLLLGGGMLLGVALYLARKNGSKSAQLSALKEELKRQAKEQARAKQITDAVCHLTTDDARRRLHDVANKQRNGM
ncbi:MAG: hypothetical protein II913_02580 [Elusimicrobiaceae bacterium]|nr:hypothetical protein [Elusimicrobiaceae bacterium]